MASTNKTSNYELSQFIGSDKPAWLSDYNGDMSKIDTGIHNAQTTATGADGKADANTTNIGDMTYLSTTAKNTLVAAINEVDTNSETAQNTANNALTTANSANTNASEALTLINKFNLSNTGAISNLSIVGGSLSYQHSVRYASNSDGSIGKIYGSLTMNVTSNEGATITFTTPFRPADTINITGASLLQDIILPSAVGQNISGVSYSVSPLGVVTITLGSSWNGHRAGISFLACLLFFKDFGDSPVTPTP